MTEYGIWLIDNKQEAKLLRKKMAPFDFAKHSKQEIRDLLKTMREAMKNANGVGLSANQIGLDMHVFVAQAEGKFYAIFNSKLTKVSDEKSTLEEGCLSVPNIFGEVTRPMRVVLEGYDRNGKKIKIKAWGLLARIFQHESDHLNGTVFIDKAKDLHTYELTNRE
ncbi:MAG: peptide deformylase [Patescibacteria group bacterium]|nr:peptide deformylase [Patescibacteria group bacterium]